MMNNITNHYKKVCTYIFCFPRYEIHLRRCFPNWLQQSTCFSFSKGVHFTHSKFIKKNLTFDRKIKSIPNPMLNKRHWKNMSMKKMQTGYVNWSIYPNFYWDKTSFVNKNPFIPDCILHFLSYSPWFQNHSTVLYKYVKIEKVWSYVLNTQ